MALRYDVGTLRAPVREPNGFLRVDGHLTRVGIFEYRDGETVRRELRSEEEVMHADSLASFKMVPVTNDHPPGLLTSNNARQFQVGSVGETVRRDGEHVAAAMIVTDSRAIADIEAGKRQLSCGYTCDFDPTPGIWKGQRYDGKQVNIRGNHVAIVDRGRAGSASLRLDHGDAVMIADADNGARAPMKKIVIKGVTVEVDDATAALYEAERADSAKILADKTAEAEKASARADAEKARADSAEKSRNDAADPVKFNERVNARVGLVGIASKLLGGNVKLDGLDDKAVRVKVLAKLGVTEVGGVKLDDKSDTYVEARFDAEVERADKANPALALVRAAAENVDDKGKPREDADDGDKEVAARKKMIDEGQAAYKSKKS